MTVIQQDKNGQIEALEEQVKQLLMKTAAQADRIAELSEWKAEKAVAIASAEQQKLLLEERTKRVEQLESTAKRRWISFRRLKMLREKQRDKLRQAEERAQQLEEEMSRPLSLYERLTGKKKKLRLQNFASSIEILSVIMIKF